MPKITIAQLFPELLNLYGDNGNVRILEQRCSWRGIDVEICPVNAASDFNPQATDIVFLGGAPDREQKLACDLLQDLSDSLTDYVEAGGVLLAICGGFQMLGSTWVMAGKTVPGLGILDLYTTRLDTDERMVGDIVLTSPLSTKPVVGYENHAGATYLAQGLQAFGSVVDALGSGNNPTDGVDGVLYKHVVGTYLHGPLLAKNPEVADWLISKALEQQGSSDTLSALDDTVEYQAQTARLKKLGIHV